jgi:hypothetical protein
MSDEGKELLTLSTLIAETGHPTAWPWAMLVTDGGISKAQATFRLAIRGTLTPGPGLWSTELTLPVATLGGD